MKRTFLAAKILLLGFLFLMPGQAFSAGIPVFDDANATQNTIAAIESVNQTLKQLEEYATQLQQYEDQIKNSLAPAAYVWSKAQQTIGKIQALQGDLMAIYSSAGNLDQYLKKFGDVNYYKDSAYFSEQSGGTKGQREQLKDGEKSGIELQKKSNEGLAKTLQQQQDQMQADADELRSLASTAQTAQGRMEAIQYGNQFASMQNGQLLQLRATLQAMHQAELAKMQTEQDVEARRIAADEAAISGSFSKVQEPAVPKFAKK